MDDKETVPLLTNEENTGRETTTTICGREEDYMTETIDQLNGKDEETKPSVRSGKLRWLMLVFGCFFLMGNYYCYDNPATLAIFLTDPHGKYNLTSAQVALFYSIYSLPNMILPLFGGVMIDKIGIK
jgi:hypothetical protein